jgi:uncharacterized protein (TIGR02722 family)
MNKRQWMMAGVAAGALALTGCAGNPVQYGDATAVETTTTGFGSTDLQMIAAKMVDDMLIFPPLVEMTAKRRPVMFVDTIKNKTTEHIDTESITDTISSKLLNSGRFRFVDMTAVQQMRDQMDYQQGGGMVDPATAVRLRKQMGAEFMLYGNMSSIVKYNGSVKDVYYKFTLKLTNLETGILEWSGEKEIRKTGQKSTFGF